MISKSYIDVDILAPLAVYIPGFIQIEWHVSEELEDRHAYVHCDHYNKIIIIKPAQEKVNRWIVWITGGEAELRSDYFSALLESFSYCWSVFYEWSVRAESCRWAGRCAWWPRRSSLNCWGPKKPRRPWMSGPGLLSWTQVGDVFFEGTLQVIKHSLVNEQVINVNKKTKKQWLSNKTNTKLCIL